MVAEVAGSSPEVTEAVEGKLGVANRVLNILVPEIVLQRSGVVAIIGELEAASVPQHVGMHAKGISAALPSLAMRWWSCWVETVRNWTEIAMPLQRGEILGYDFNRMVVEFTMLNQGNTVQCAISTAAMDDLEGKRDVKADQRVDQFVRLRDAIEERASRKFFEGPVETKGPLVLRSNDFFK
jgi:hypothetical protein